MRLGSFSVAERAGAFELPAEKCAATKLQEARSSLRCPASAEKSRQDAPFSHSWLFRALDSYKYVGFEDQFRGSRDAIRARLESYLPFFAGAADVLDIGCGRGEFLELLAGAGIKARGIDLNHEMAELCRSRGLDVTEADAVGYLSMLPDASLGGIFAAQVVEHLQPGYLSSSSSSPFTRSVPAAGSSSKR